MVERSTKTGSHPFSALIPVRVVDLVLPVCGALLVAVELPAQTGPEAELSSTAVHVEVTLPGSPAAVYDAITGDISGWWDHTFAENPARLFIEATPGGRFLEIFDEATGDGVLHGTVIYAKRGERLRFEGPLGFSGEAVQIVTTYDFAAVGSDSTLLVVRVNAAGTLDQGQRRALAAVWDHFIVRRFKPYMEARHAAGLPPLGTPADREGIARLHARDMAARAGDAEGLAALWTDDVVALPPGGRTRRGKAEALAALRSDLAESADKLLRVLRRDPSGEWRVHRTIWNVDG